MDVEKAVSPAAGFGTRFLPVTKAQRSPEVDIARRQPIGIWPAGLPREGMEYDEDVASVIEEAADLSQRLGAVWTDDLPAY